MIGAIVMALVGFRDGPPVDQLRLGVNLSGWFSYPPKETQAHFRGKFAPSDATFLRSQGFTHVRIPIEPSVIADQNGWRLKRDVWRLVIEGAAMFQKEGLAVILDLHPSQSTVAEPNGSPERSQTFLVLWDQMAGNLNGLDLSKTWLEPCNEPHSIGDAAWQALQEQVVARLRKKLPNVPIVLTGAQWGGIDGLVKVKPLADTNVVYSFHFYDPHTFTHQGAFWGNSVRQQLKGIPYPVSREKIRTVLPRLLDAGAKLEAAQYADEGWNRQKLFRRVKQAVDWARRNRVQLYCGEFGAYGLVAPDADRALWYRDTIEALKSNRIPMCFWDYLGSRAFGIADGGLGQRSLSPMVLPLIRK